MMVTKRTTVRRAALATGTAMVLALSAGATNPAGAQSAEQQLREMRQQMQEMREKMQNLQKQVQENEAQVNKARGGGKKSIQPEYPVNLTVAGRVNQALLYAEQEDQDQAFVVDNDGSGSRFEFLAETSFGQWTSGVEIVVSAEVNSSDEITFNQGNQGNNDNGPDLGNFRQAHWFIESDNLGYFSIGQGDTASEDSGHVDLSNTGQAGAGSDVDDMAGGLQFVAPGGQDLRVAGGGAPTNDDELDDFFDALDGSRGERVMYKTPSLGGLALKASLRNTNTELTPSIGAEYSASFQGFDVEAAAAWRENPADESTIHGSASVMSPIGINLTFMGATSENDGTTDAGNQIEDPNAFFIKAGYEANIAKVGPTAFSIDYYTGRANDTFVSPAGNLPEAQSFGAAVLQEIEPLAAELYLTGRIYDVEDVTALANDGAGGNSSSVGDPDEMFALMSGARVRF